MRSFQLRALMWSVALALAPRVQIAQAPATESVIAITRANIVDGVSTTRIRNATILIRDGRIASIRVGGPVPNGATVIDVAGRWIAPGMIDAHTHISTLANARRALHSGVTTVRSASVPAFQDVALRELAKAGQVWAPDVLAAGVFVTPQLGETLLADARLGSLAGGVRTDDALRHVVRVNAERGVDWIKTRGTERAGLPDTDPRQQTYTEAQLRVVVEAARTHGIPVMAHAHGDEGAYAAVAAGVRSIEHGTYLSDSTLQLMRQRGTWFVPTLSTVWDLTTPGGDYDDPVLQLRGQHMAPILEDAIRRAHRIGVRIAAGADTDYHTESTTRIAHEVLRFSKLGLSPLEALVTATSGAAELLGIGDRTGRVAEGYEADLILIEHDPLERVETLQDVLMVMTNGRVALNRFPFGLSAK
jgi:imidazolonepropionase-like amidohydrolase